MTDESKERADEVRRMVREGYGSIARTPEADGCCTPSAAVDRCGPNTAAHAKAIGYTEGDLEGTTGEANLGLGCGNPTALAALSEGEVVLDLGAGAGFDALIAAPRVGPTGRVIGVDMTPEMLERARTNAVKAGVASHVEFREGVIENLPVVSDSVDVVISNCVINLSPDKGRAFAEAFRVLKPGGRLAVSDVLHTETLPPEVAQTAQAYIACIGGASLAEHYLRAIEEAGFTQVKWTRQSARPLLSAVLDNPDLKSFVDGLPPGQLDRILESTWSYSIEASKPRETR